MFVDSHCHLNYPGLAERQQEVLAKARATGVTAMLNIATRAAEWDAVLETAEREPDVWASVGIHPHDADTHEGIETAMLVERSAHPRVIGIGETGLDFYYDRSDRERQRASFRRHIAASRETGLPLIVHSREAEAELLDNPQILIDHARHPKVVGIGETGLDYYYEHSPREQQIVNFRHHIAAARETGLPLIVHTRDADDDTIRVLDEEMAQGPFTGLLHCFTGTQRLADAALELGLSISVSGIATFKNSGALRDVLKSVPPERLLVETDAPYLAPVPHRGKRNEPAFVVHTAQMLAGLKGLAPDDLARITTDNFFRLFPKVSRPQPTAADM